MLVWWFSPHLVFFWLFEHLFFVKDDGEIHRRGVMNYYSRSPLSMDRTLVVISVLVYSCRGDYREEEKLILSFSPLFFMLVTVC